MIDEKIKKYLDESESFVITTSSWGEGSVNGKIKIDCGKFATIKELHKNLKVSKSNIYKGIQKLKSQKVIRICNKRPMLINLIEQPITNV